VSGTERLEARAIARQRGVAHAFFTRKGGVSDGLYASLNCGLGSKDREDAVAENRARAAAALGTEALALLTAYQVHGTAVVEVTRPWTQDERPQADGLVSRTPGIALGILTADCAPVLFADAEARVVGAAHAGWKGALAGVTEATIAAMEGLGADRARIAAAIGPCIAQSSYEVGTEFPAPFLAARADDERFFAAARGGKFRFDLEGYVAARLARAGIGTIERLGRDTCADDATFFSYRRSCLRAEGDFGRGLSAIMLAP
jgi:YfiH family protein